MMSGLPSALRVSAWKIAPETPSAAPDQQRHQHARHPPVEHHHPVERIVRSDKDAEHIAGCDCVLADADGHDRDEDGGDRQRGHHRHRPP
jgi:hypothetical protein